MDILIKYQYVLIQQMKFLTNHVDAKIIYKSNIAIKKPCSLFSNIVHNGIIHPEIIKEIATTV